MKGGDERGKLIDLIAYLLASAEILPDEPRVYGPMRLIEGAKRLIEILESEREIPPELIKIKEIIDDALNLVLVDEEGFLSKVKEAVKEMAKYLKKSNSVTEH